MTQQASRGCGPSPEARMRMWHLLYSSQPRGEQPSQRPLVTSQGPRRPGQRPRNEKGGLSSRSKGPTGGRAFPACKSRSRSPGSGGAIPFMQPPSCQALPGAARAEGTDRGQQRGYRGRCGPAVRTFCVSRASPPAPAVPLWSVFSSCKSRIDFCKMLPGGAWSRAHEIAALFPAVPGDPYYLTMKSSVKNTKGKNQ